MISITTGLTMLLWGYDDKMPIRATRECVDRFCIEHGYKTGQRYTFDKQRFSNDKGRLMANYQLVDGVYKWVGWFCFDSVITSIIIK